MASGPAPAPPRLLLLDGLRAIAAAGVLLFHVDFAFDNLPLFHHAELAVDFFFLLSGFVLNAGVEQHADRQGGAARFFLARVCRLWPMMAGASILGFAVAWSTGRSLADLLPVLLLALLFLPGSTPRAAIFPLNTPQWSLLAELIANAVHAFAFRHMRTRFLLVFAGLCWIGIVSLALSKGEIAYGPIYPGWHLGLLRIGFAYTMGCVLARHMSQLRVFGRLPWWAPVLMLIVLLVRPGRPQLLDGLWDAMTLLAFVPVLAAAIVVRPPRSLGNLMQVAGAASWPLYAFHSPILAMAAWLTGKGVLNAGTASTLGVGAALALAFALGPTRFAKGIPIIAMSRGRSTQGRLPAGA